VWHGGCFSLFGVLAGTALTGVTGKVGFFDAHNPLRSIKMTYSYGQFAAAKPPEADTWAMEATDPGLAGSAVHRRKQRYT